MEKLTMQEEEAMRWIWRIGPCFVKDVLAKYEDPKPPYTTLASVIKNLERKKYVKAKRYGNTYEYRPLIEETEKKAHVLSPREAQTGPAVRYDEKIINKHLELLSNEPQMQEIYQLISKSIHNL